MKQIFIDGSAGTTGLRIRDRLADRSDIRLISLPEELRKDATARADALNTADIAFLCLPDAAAAEAVILTTDSKTVLIDTSTAHRTAKGWTYGFPELSGQRDKIRGALRIANPGCHATGFIALVSPLLASGVIQKDLTLSCFSLTGYSGGGKKMIAAYESDERSPLLKAPRQYGLSQTHKHLAEMTAVCGLDSPPVFCPIVADYYAGMEVTVPLTWADTWMKPDEIRQVYRQYYSGEELIHVSEDADEEGFLSANAFAGRDDLEISVYGQEERILLIARFDNLGKGASGAAIQNMNLVMGLPECTGLVKG